MSPRPSLILIPGLLCDETVWRNQVEAFAGTHEVIVPALDGLDSIAGMAAAFLARAPAEFALAGHSLGGRIALEAVRQAPLRVNRLALLDTGVHPCTPGEPARRQELVSLAFAEGMHAVARAWLPPMVHPDRRADPTLMAALDAMVERRSPATFRNQIEALLNRPDAAPVLASIRCPTLVLCGREDGWSPLAQHEAIAAAISGSVLAVIDACGHMAPFERPAEVTRELRRWLA
ncbi:MAG TPA: alpha/beta hydrolase [Steroidobacteraceae bacterium]